MKKLISILLSFCLIFALSVPAFAAEIDTSGGTASTPVYLSSTKDGTVGGAPAATAMSVTVPTSLPMTVNQQGDVTTATDCKIVNNSYGAVRVRSVTISAGESWHLTSFGEKSSLAAEKVNSNKLGFSLKVGAGTQVQTSGTAATQQLISAPVTGCYMTGNGDTAKNFVPVTYAAIVTPMSQPVTEANIANVVFVVEWDTV